MSSSAEDSIQRSLRDLHLDSPEAPNPPTNDTPSQHALVARLLKLLHHRQTHYMVQAVKAMSASARLQAMEDGSSASVKARVAALPVWNARKTNLEKLATYFAGEARVVERFGQQVDLEWTAVRERSDQHRNFVADGLWAIFVVLSEASYEYGVGLVEEFGELMSEMSQLVERTEAHGKLTAADREGA